MNYIVVNEKTNKEKKTPVYFIINAGSIAAAHETLVEHMKGTIADYEIATLDDTRIMDVYVYSADGSKSVAVKAANMKQTPETIIDKACSGTRTREEVEAELICTDEDRPLTTLDPQQPYGEDDEG